MIEKKRSTETTRETTGNKQHVTARDSTETTRHTTGNKQYVTARDSTETIRDFKNKAITPKISHIRDGDKTSYPNLHFSREKKWTKCFTHQV